ncbi:hypothetical protein [Legionella sp. W05-934-2]|jgi:hypothetical protein|uniref:hypothetical protein n=1 Tax=Legionella sp. W05-934-2 TaxID=1198649 RepID=UPI003462A868
MTQSKKDELRRIQEEAARKTMTANQEMSKNLTTFILPNPKLANDEGEDKDAKLMKAIEDYNRLVLDAYRKEFEKEPLKDKNGHDVLEFGSHEEAIAFFKKLAAKKIPFMVIEVDANGNPNGRYALSYGDGELLEGKVNPDQLNNIRQDFINNLKGLKKEPENTDKSDFKNRFTELKERKSPNPEKSPASSTDPSITPNPIDVSIPKARPKQ